MRKREMGVAVAAAVLCAPGTAQAGPAGDSVTGGAQDFTGAHVSVSASNGPGGDARGHVNATLPNPLNPGGGTLQFRLQVTCLAVTGDVASIGAVTTDASANDVPPGFPFVITVRDSRRPGGAGDGLDVFPGAPANTCPAFLSQAAASPSIEEGSLHVRDNV